MYGATMGTIRLESYNGATWSQLWTMKGNKGDTWLKASVTLPVGTVKLRFTGQTTTSYTSDFLDDLVVRQGASPTTQAVTTMPPVTQAPTTAPPVTQAPTPATQPPQPTPSTTGPPTTTTLP